MRPLLPWLLFGVLLPIVSVDAQTAFEEKVTVTFVEVPVTVIGRDGAPVRGLARENFELFENGDRRAIESFEEIDFAAAGMARRVSPLSPEAQRKFVLLFDLSYSSPISLGRAQKAAREFVARSIGSRDRVAVATVDAERGFRFLTAFTTDRDILTAAVADPRGFRAVDPLQISGASLSEMQPPSPIAAFDDEEDRFSAGAVDVRRQQARLDREHERGRIRRQIAMLTEVGRSLQRLAGRKHLVLLSEGFDSRLVQGRSAGETQEQMEENDAIARGESWKVDSDQRYGNTSSQNSLAIMADAFRRGDVVLHAVDLRGVRVQNDIRQTGVVSSNEGLLLLADATGGTVFRNSNDMSGQLDRLTRQHEVVYVLGFRAPSGREGEFHELKVKLAGVPRARVEHRGGYYSAGNESIVERSLSTAEVIVNDIAQPDIAITPLVRAFPMGDHALVPVVLEISGPDLIRHARGGRATTDILLYAFDADGVVRDSVFQRVVLEMAQVEGKLRAAGIRFYAALSLEAGEYAVKALVRVAESDRKGFERVDLTIAPEGDASIVAPVFFQDPGEWVMVKAAEGAGSAPYPFVLDGDSFIPETAPELKSGEPRLFAVYVYNAEPGELTWEITPEAKLVSFSRGEDATTYLFALEKVPAGTSRLDVSVRKKDSNETRTATVPISVE